MTKALIFGNYGAKNFGDELVLRGILNIIKDKKYDIRVLSSDPKETKKLHNVKSGWVFPTGLKSLLRGRIFRTLKYYWQADIIIFGGGTLFTNEEPRTIWISGIQILPAILMRKKIVCFRQGVGPIKHKRIIRWIFNRFAEITVRDKESKKHLREIGVKKEIHVEEDPAFSLQTEKAHGEELLVSLRDVPDLDPEFEKKFIAFLKWTKMPIRIMVFGEEDQKLSDRIAQQTDAKVTRITLENYKDIFRRGGIALNFRLHANILSIMYGIPCVGFAYEDKIKNLFMEKGIEEYLIEIKNIDIEILKDKFNKLKAAS